MHFIYSSHDSLASANDALDSYCAEGITSLEEGAIVKFYLGRWRVMFPA